MNRLKNHKTPILSLITIAIIILIYTAQPVQAINYTYDSLNRLTQAIYQPGQEISYSYDNSGNILTVTAVGFDDIPPVTSIQLTGQAGQQDWYRSDVQVTLSAVDNPDGTGVAKTEYSNDSNTWTAYSQPITVSAEGLTDLYYRSIDNVGNIETAQKAVIKIDKTPPVIQGTATTPATAYGWHNSDVTIHFTGSDVLSGVAGISPDITLTQEGAGQIVEGTVTDLAGNTAQTTLTINIDKTMPVITAAAATQPNAAGWYKEDVTILFTASDALSGVDTVTPDTVVSTEGANQSVTGTVTDKAGNTASVTYSGINLDKTAPVTTCTPDREPNQNGWYKEDIKLTLTAADKEGGSGVVRSEYSLDNISWTTYSEPIIISTEGITEVYYRSIDLADNLETFNQLTIKLDKTPPVITGAPTTQPNQNGWWNSDVTIHFTAEDPISGIDTLTPDVIVSTEAANQTVTGTAVDKAGNSASYTVENINLDKTKPQIIITSPAENQEYILHEQVAAAWTANDTLSGIETAEGTVPDGSHIDTDTVGEKTFTVTAVDLAGNQETQTIIYYVRYNYTLLSPRDGKRILKGRPVLVRFRLTDAQGNSAPDAVAQLYLTGPDGQEIEARSATHVALGLVSGITQPDPDSQPINDLLELIGDETDLSQEELMQILGFIHNTADDLASATAGNQFSYYMLSQQYIFDLYTCNLQTGNWQLRIALDDGTSKYSSIQLFEIIAPLLDQIQNGLDQITNPLLNPEPINPPPAEEPNPENSNPDSDDNAEPPPAAEPETNPGGEGITTDDPDNNQESGNTPGQPAQPPVENLDPENPDQPEADSTQDNPDPEPDNQEVPQDNPEQETSQP